MTWQSDGVKHWDAAMSAALERDGDALRICQARKRDYRGQWYLVCGYPLDPVIPAEVHPWCERFEAPPHERQRYVPQRGRELALVKAAERRRMAAQAAA